MAVEDGPVTANLFYDTMEMPNRFRREWDHLRTQERLSYDDAVNRIRSMMSDEFPEKGEPIGVLLCPETWVPLLAWREPDDIGP